MLPLTCIRGLLIPEIAFVRRYHWPSVPNPTPYQIFGLNPSEKPNEKTVRKIYFDLVKIYHPDRGGSAERFKSISEAHKILLQHCKGIKSEYGMDQPPHYYRPSTTANPFTDHGFYDTTQSEEQFKEELRANRVWVLKLVVSVTVIIALLNVVVIKNLSESHGEAVDKQTEKIALSLLANTPSKPKEETPESRIRRFLEHRQRTLNKFEDFSYNSISKGKKRRDTLEDASNKNDMNSEEKMNSTSNDSEKKEKCVTANKLPPPTKHNTGKVAEYFGRN